MRKSERKTKIEKPKQTLATTTPLVRGIFDSMFNEQLDEAAAKTKKRRCGICEVTSLFETDVSCYVKKVFLAPYTETCLKRLLKNRQNIGL